MKPRMPRRILMTADPIGGVWTFALELARSFEPYGIEIGLATMGARLSPIQRRELAGRKNVHLFESNYRLEWMDDPWHEVDRAGEWLLHIAESFQPDLVHLNGYSHAVLPWSVPVIVSAHSCVLSWWRAVKNENAPARYDEYRERVAAGLEAADVVTAPSAAMRDSLSDNYGYWRDCAVIHNGRDPRLFSSRPKSALVFSCGRVWDEAKNLHSLDAIALRSDWPIEVAGDCRHPTGSTVALSHVRCVGTLPPRDMADRFAHAAIFVLPARYEPFGLSVLEAALSGCALVLGDIPSLREIWQDTAVFTAPDDASALAEILNGLIRNNARRCEFAARARTRALTFSPHGMGERYLGCYQSCFDTEVMEVPA